MRRLFRDPDTQTVEVGSEAIVRMALLDGDGPSAMFVDANGPVPW